MVRRNFGEGADVIKVYSSDNRTGRPDFSVPELQAIADEAHRRGKRVATHAKTYEGARNALLAAISCGAVFMGCLTYIGNGPNLMIKEVAEHRGVRMPHFFAYAVAAAAIMQSRSEPRRLPAVLKSRAERAASSARKAT